MRSNRLVILCLLALFVSILVPMSALAQATSANKITFAFTDEPGAWFKNQAGPVAGSNSLAIGTPGVDVIFEFADTNTVHTNTSLLWPTGAVNMPLDTSNQVINKGTAHVVLTTPGLYVFFCRVHPYMFAAVIVDDPTTVGLDLGNTITLVNGITVPTSSDLATRLLRTFLIATNPSNWKNYASGSTTWHVTYPNVDVRITGGAVVNLRDVLNARYGNDLPLAPLTNPSTPAVGDIWVDTQFELTAGKTKPGTATVIDGTTWQPKRKVALPQINLNNPHNMWTDRNQSVIYQTQWFDNKLAVFDRGTGAFINNIKVGEAPAHVMTRVDTDQVHVTLNGELGTSSVAELAPLAANIVQYIDIGRGNPHAHWMSHDGQRMVTPNAFTNDSTQYNFGTNSIESILPAGTGPIATGMMPDASKYYVGSLLDSTVTVIDMKTHSIIKTINLLANYDPISGAISGPVGALPIQTPVSPNGKFMVTANTLTATITIASTATDTLVTMLPCDPGCHGAQWGAKQGGGYYAYVSSKFSNVLLVVDPDPDNDGNPADAAIVGLILLAATASTTVDDTITGNVGMGGQGVLPVPVVYNGWVQNLPQFWKNQLTPGQINPFPEKD